MQPSNSGAVNLFKSNMLVIQKHKEDGKKLQKKVHLQSLNRLSEGKLQTEEVVKLAKQFQQQNQRIQNTSTPNPNNVVFELLPVENTSGGLPSGRGSQGVKKQTTGGSPRNSHSQLQHVKSHQVLDSFRKQGGSSVAKLKASQIIHDAKQDLKGPHFGNTHDSRAVNNRELGSLVSLRTYLQPAQSAAQLQTLPGVNQTIPTVPPNNDMVNHSIKTKFTLKKLGGQQSRFKNANEQYNSNRDPHIHTSPTGQAPRHQPAHSVLSNLDLKEDRRAEIARINDKIRSQQHSQLANKQHFNHPPPQALGYRHKSNHSTQSSQGRGPLSTERTPPLPPSKKYDQLRKSQPVLPQRDSRQVKTLNAYPSQKVLGSNNMDEKYKVPFSVSLANSGSQKNFVSPLRGKQQRVIKVVQNYQRPQQTLQSPTNQATQREQDINEYTTKSSGGANIPSRTMDTQNARNSDLDTLNDELRNLKAGRAKDAYSTGLLIWYIFVEVLTSLEKYLYEIF